MSHYDRPEINVMELLAERDKLRAEVERLRAEANARAVEELTALNGMSELSLRAAIQVRIAELSKPAAKESEPVRPVTGPNYLDQEERGHTKPAKDELSDFYRAKNAAGKESKPEEPDWTVTLAAQAKVAYANSAAPADELKVRLLSLVVQGLCNLGREVRKAVRK